MTAHVRDLNWFRLKDELIERVKRGEISREAAEGEMRSRELPSIARSPDPEKLKVEEEVYWSLYMALAWIAWRDLSAVREMWNPWRAEIREWAPRDLGGDGDEPDAYTLELRQPANWAALETQQNLHLAQGLRPLISLERAEKKLWLALQEGQLSAAARDRMTRATVAPQPSDWRWYRLSRAHKGNVQVELGGGPETPIEWIDVVLESAILQQLWPASGSHLRPCEPGKRASGRTRWSPRQNAAASVDDALTALFPDGRPAGIQQQRRFDQVNAWLTEAGRHSVGLSTLQRVEKVRWPKEE